MVALNGTVRLIALQFSFANPDAIPDSVKHRDRETQEERVERKSHANGIVVIEPTEKCSLADLLGDLEKAGYELVDAFYKERINPNYPRGKKTYHAVRFLFARRELVKIGDEFKEVRDQIRFELQNICDTAIWRVRAFSNPFFKDGEEVPGERAVSINLEVRQPLFKCHGETITAWQTDEKGRRLGDAPLPLKAKHNLRIVNDSVTLVTA